LELNQNETIEVEIAETVSLSPSAQAPSIAVEQLSKVTVEPATSRALPKIKDKAYFEQYWFRAFEFLAASTLLIVLSPLMLLTSIALKFQGFGSVFYKQVRVGLNGKTFTIFKFRTMYQDAEKSGPFICTSYTDARITPFGARLRKSKIDELPQLWNVMLGDMSFLGPRPERPCFHQEFLSIENWKRRVKVKPGITGLAQISAIISHDPKQKIIADIAYLNNRTFWSDIYVMIITVLSFLRPKFIFGIPIK